MPDTQLQMDLTADVRPAAKRKRRWLTPAELDAACDATVDAEIERRLGGDPAYVKPPRPKAAKAATIEKLEAAWSRLESLGWESSRRRDVVNALTGDRDEFADLTEPEAQHVLRSLTYSANEEFERLL